MNAVALVVVVVVILIACYFTPPSGPYDPWGYQ